MKPLLIRVVILLILLGGYGSLQPAEVQGEWGITCYTCDVTWDGWARCMDTYTLREGWDYCVAVTQDPSDPQQSFCLLGWYCPWTQV